jgi:protocatechuate 3,4-dioxygenase beta subunit
MRRFSSVLAVCVLLMAARGFAQFSSSVQGTILDSNGAAVPNATVSLVNSDTNVTVTHNSDAAGVYRFVSIAPGNYTVSASAPGFTTVKVEFKL